MTKKEKPTHLTSVYFSGDSYYVRIVPHHIDTERLGFPHGLSMLPTHIIGLSLNKDEQKLLNDAKNNEAKQQAVQTQELLIKLISEFKKTPKELWLWTKQTKQNNEIWLSLNVPDHLKEYVVYDQLILFATPCKTKSEADEFEKRISDFLDEMAINYQTT